MQALYQLQRGPMLGQIAGHPDERALLQSTFLASAGLVALRMLLPQLFVFNASTGAFEATPAVDLALATGQLCLPESSLRRDISFDASASIGCGIGDAATLTPFVPPLKPVGFAGPEQMPA